MSLLQSSSEGPTLIVCNTCRWSAEEREDAQGVRGGVRMFEALTEAARGDVRLETLAIEQMPCLFNCSQHCSIHLRGPDKIGYVLGKFEPTSEAAQAILDYAAAWLESDEGVVPYRQWPEGVKGHFIVRVPPPGMTVVS